MKLSVFLPTIRTHLLPEFCDFLRRSYSGDLEVVLAGPFAPFQVDSARYNNAVSNKSFYDTTYNLHWKWIQSYQSPTCAAQEAALACTGDLILHSVDDTLYLPGALDELVSDYVAYQDSHDIQGGKDVIFNAPYCDSPEGYQFLKKEKFADPNRWSHPSNYWTAANAGYGGIPNIDPNCMTTCHFLMWKETFSQVGGFDCQFEYCNHSCHDLLYRLYLNGAYGVSLDETVSLADWIPDRQGDHGPINDAQLFHDHPLFIKKWSTLPELKIDPLNYKQQEEVWERRFNKGGQKEYGELGYA